MVNRIKLKYVRENTLREKTNQPTKPHKKTYRLAMVQWRLLMADGLGFGSYIPEGQTRQFCQHGHARHFYT